MNNPVPARAHANMSVAEREFTFDALLAEFGDDANGVVETPARRAAPETAPQVLDAAAPTARRARALLSPEVLKLGGLIAVAALSLTLVFIALSR